MDVARERAAMNRRHRDSDRPSVGYRNVQERDGLSADEAAVMAVLQTTPACSRERDMAVLTLSHEQIKLYLETMCVPMEPEDYMQQVRGYWKFIESRPDIYEPDGTPRWRKHIQGDSKGGA